MPSDKKVNETEKLFRRLREIVNKQPSDVAVGALVTTLVSAARSTGIARKDVHTALDLTWDVSDKKARSKMS